MIPFFRGEVLKGKILVPALMVLSAVFTVPVFSQESGPPPTGQSVTPAVRNISPDEAVELAIKNNLSLQSSLIAVDTKKRKSDLYWNQFIPSVDVRGSLIGDNKAGTVSGMVPVPLPGGSGVYGIVPYSITAPQWHFSASLAASLNLSFALFEGIRNFRLDYEAGLLSYEKAKLQIERDVRKSYYNILLIQENIKLKKESYAAAERQETMARANYRAGLVPELTLLQAQVAKENQKPELDELENNLKMLMANFAMTLGLPYDTVFDLIPFTGTIDFVPLDVRELIAKAASGKPDLLELKQNILVLESARKAQALQLHTPYLALSWNTAPLLQDVGANWFKKDSWTPSGSFSLTIGMNLNGLIPFLKEDQGLKDMDNSIRSLNISLGQAIRGTEIEIYNTVLSLQKAQSSVEALTLTVNLAERSYRSTEQAYRAGLQDLLQVQTAGDQLNQARLGVLAQNFTYLSGLIDLEYAIGVPFGTLTGSVK
jgi:outer membrane protein TolC